MYKVTTLLPTLVPKIILSFFPVSCPKNILKSLSKMLKKKKFELQIFFFWLTFCLPGNIVTGYLYNTSSLPAESNNQTEETCQTTDYPDNKQVLSPQSKHPVLH